MTETHLTAPTRFIDVDGVRLAYRRWGQREAGQPPLLLLQHFRGGMDHWDPFIDVFSQCGVGMPLRHSQTWLSQE
jgi:pimeloyl-ACP methyl ester carboxylesterase